MGKIKHSVIEKMNEKSRFSGLKLDSCPKGYIAVNEAVSGLQAEDIHWTIFKTLVCIVENTAHVIPFNRSISVV